MIRSFIPYARPTYNGERRPTPYGLAGEWLHELPRRSLGERVWSAIVRLVVCGGMVLAVCAVVGMVR